MACCVTFINMKSIRIQERELQYQTIWDCDEVGEWCWTEFYEGTVEVTKRKFPQFWKKYTVIEPRILFKIEGANTEDPRLLKSWWKKKIEENLEMLGRSNEIKRGELI